MEFTEQMMQAALRKEFTLVTGVLRVAGVWGLGYDLHERLADWRLGIQLGSAGLELTSDYASFEVLRQQMLDHQEIADSYDDGPVRADARLVMMEYYQIRTFRPIMGLENNPVVKYNGEGLISMTAGGEWSGAITEITALIFPALKERSTVHWMMEKAVAMTNAIASFPRDQREGTTNALISIYATISGDPAGDLRAICDYVDNAEGDELTVVSHFSASTNNHSRYIMLAVFLAAARLGRISLAKCELNVRQLATAIAFAERIQFPENCLTTPRKDREIPITTTVNRIWVAINQAEIIATDKANSLCSARFTSICRRGGDVYLLANGTSGYLMSCVRCHV